MKTISILCEDGYKYKYPQVPDLAETLARRGHAVEVIAPGDPETEAWNAGRGFRHNAVAPRFSRGMLRSLHFNLVAAWRARRSDYVVPCTTVTLAAALLAHLLFGRRFGFYALECQVPGDREAGTYAVLQHLLRYTTKVVTTTGPHRSRVLERYFRLHRRPSFIENTALLPAAPSTPPADAARSIVDDARAAGAAPAMRIVVANAGLSPVNCIDLVLDAMPRLPANVFLVFFGAVDPAIAARFHAVVQGCPNALYLGKIPGNRQSLIAYMRGADVGLVLKHRGKGYCLNDRLYTPNKIYDYIAAGVVPLCTRNIPLRPLVRSGLCLGVRDDTADAIADAFREIADASDAELAARRRRVVEAFRATLNYRVSSQAFVDDLEADMR